MIFWWRFCWELIKKHYDDNDNVCIAVFSTSTHNVAGMGLVLSLLKSDVILWRPFSKWARCWKSRFFAKLGANLEHIWSKFGANLEQFWAKLGAKLEETWAKLGANLEKTCASSRWSSSSTDNLVNFKFHKLSSGTMAEKLCLQWNDFRQNISASFGDLRGDKEFSDVTLACEDGQQVEAHKVILASSSPFFKELLRKNKHPHPLLYMRALKSDCHHGLSLFWGSEYFPR